MEKTIPQNLNVFGKNYVFQHEFSDLKVLEQTKENWRKAGHSVMVKKGCRLYVSQFKTRSY